LKKGEFEIITFGWKKHYDIVGAWWLEHKWPIIPLSSLPINGLFVKKNGELAAIGFLYLFDCDAAMIEWITVNPFIDAEERSGAVGLLIDELCSLARKKQCRIVFMALNNDKLIARAETRGFQVTERNMTHLIRNLG
jgi:hypothetical protein